MKRVRQNKGSPGVDGMTVDELPEYLVEHWEAIREQLLAGTYQPKPVREVEIPKSGGGVRKLGIPTALDLLKRHICKFVPDPASSYGSSYEECADWMAAVLELAPEEYRKILRGWQEVHQRRRNLWKAMSARRLPI